VASNLGTPLRILVFGHSNGSSHWRRWRHLAYMNASYPMSVAGIGELLDFVCSGRSNMHRCCAFPFVLARLSCRPLSRRLAPPPPAGIVWRRRQPKSRRRATKPAEIIRRRRRNFYAALRLVVIRPIGLVVKLVMIAAVITVCYRT